MQGIIKPQITLLLALLGQHACIAAAPLSSWLESAAAIEPWIIERQTELHRIPELLFDTPKTYAALEKYLTDIGVKYRCAYQASVKTCALKLCPMCARDLKAWRAYSCAPCVRRRRPKSGRGIIAEIGTGKPPIVVLRSDIDGLPIREEGSAAVKCEAYQQERSHVIGCECVGRHMQAVLSCGSLGRAGVSTMGRVICAATTATWPCCWEALGSCTMLRAHLRCSSTKQGQRAR